MNKKIIILCILVAALIVGIFWYTKKVNIKEQNQSTSSVPISHFTRTDVALDKAPDKFPKDIPGESGAKVTQNYNVSTPDGRYQATRVFESNKSLIENFSIYKNYLTSNGYNIQSTVDQTSYKMIFGIKGDKSLQVTMDESTGVNIKTVNISYIEPITPSTAQ